MGSISPLEESYFTTAFFCFSNIRSETRRTCQNTCLFFSIDMYTEGMMDLDEMVLYQPYLPKEEKEGNLAKIKDKARNRYFPAYEKVSASCLTLEHSEGLFVLSGHLSSSHSCSTKCLLSVCVFSGRWGCELSDSPVARRRNALHCCLFSTQALHALCKGGI